MTIRRTPGGVQLWTPEMDDLLTQLWNTRPTDADYMPTVRIGDTIRRNFPTFEGSLTKNAIIGRAGRLKLAPRIRVLFKSKKRKTAMARMNTASFNGPPVRKAVQSSWAGRNTNALKAAVAKQEPEPPFEPTENNISYMKAGDSQCVWPVGHIEGETIVCGNKRYDNGSLKRPSMYCAHHAQQGSAGPQTMRPGHTPERRGRRATPRFS